MDILSSIIKQSQFSGSVYFCSSFQEDWGFDVGKSDTFRFHVLLEGSAVIGFEGKTMLLKAGDVVAFPNGCGHWISYRKSSIRKQFSHFELHAQPLNIATVQLKSTIMSGSFDVGNNFFTASYFSFPNCIHLAKESEFYNQWINSIVRKINQEILSQSQGSELSIDRQTELIFIEIVRHWLKQSQFDQNLLKVMRDPVVSNVLSLFHKYPEKNYKLQLVANQVGVSRSTLNSAFQKQLGTSPMNYLTGLRIYQAQNLLKDTEQPLLDIALSIGYLSDSALSKKFKAVTGIAPGEFRKRYRAKAV